MAFATNVYDTLGRVQSQTNTNNQTYLARLAGATNTAVGKAVTAASGEIIKGRADGKSATEYGTSAVIAGALNASGAVGKAAELVAKRMGAVKEGFVPNPRVAALLQPKAEAPTHPAVAASVVESIGSLPNYSYWSSCCRPTGRPCSDCSCCIWKGCDAGYSRSRWR